MKTFASPASTILVTNSDGTRYDIGDFSQLKNSVSQHQHVGAVDPCAVDRDAHRRILDATPAEQAEVLLVDRRGHDELAIDVADDAAREHVRAREGIAIADGEEALVIQPEDCYLLAVHQRAYAAVGHDGV